jgi:hypothetical protein
MNQERPVSLDPMKQPSTVRNPYIVNFCKVLTEKKGESLEPEAEKKLLDDMYRLFENMLGQNMIKALPDELRKQYLSLTEDPSSLNYDKIGKIFENVPDYQGIMKETMQEFSEIFMRNRRFDPRDYPVPIE